MGPSPRFCHHLVQPFGLEPVLEAPGPVSHLDSLKYMVQSHVLWLVVPKPFIISAKIFYYLGAGRPILGVAPLGGSLDQLLQQTGMGVTLAPEDIAAFLAGFADRRSGAGPGGGAGTPAGGSSVRTGRPGVAAAAEAGRAESPR